jgi:hypothetical protein
MAFLPVSGVPIQLQRADGEFASGYYLKFYVAGTTTPLNMATDSTGATLLDKCAIDANGFPINTSLAPFIPFVEEDYAIAVYTNAADADANNTGSAFVFIDNVPSNLSAGTVIASSANEPDLVDTDVALITGSADPDNEQHLEFGPGQVQSKADDITAAALTLNTLGGAIEVGSSSTQSDVTIFGGTSGAPRFKGLATSSQIYGGAGGDPAASAVQSGVIELVNDSDYVVTSFTYGGTTDLSVKNLVRSGLLILSARDSSGTDVVGLQVEPDLNKVQIKVGELGVDGYTFTLGAGDPVTNGNTGLSRALAKTSGGVLSINHGGDFPGGILLEGPQADVDGYVLTLGAGDQVTNGNTGLSRALVKDSGGVLAINYSNDYASVRVNSDFSVTGAATFGSFTVTSFSATSATITTLAAQDVTLTNALTAPTLAADVLRGTVAGSAASVVFRSPFAGNTGFFFGSTTTLPSISDGGTTVAQFSASNGVVAPIGVRFGGASSTLAAVPNTLGIYHGRVSSVGVAVELPSGWSSAQISTGVYEITHNLNTLEYSVIPTAELTGNTPVANPTSIGLNTFRINVADSANHVAVNGVTAFILLTNP